MKIKLLELLNKESRPAPRKVPKTTALTDDEAQRLVDVAREHQVTESAVLRIAFIQTFMDEAA